MDILIMAAVVLAMIALTAFLIHLLNARHRHQHLRAVHYDHGLAGFGGFGGLVRVLGVSFRRWRPCSRRSPCGRASPGRSIGPVVPIPVPGSDGGAGSDLSTSPDRPYLASE